MLADLNGFRYYNFGPNALFSDSQNYVYRPWGASLTDRNNQLIRNKTCNFRTNILFECLKALGPSKSLKIVAHIWSEKCSKNNRDTEFTETHGSGMGTESLSGTAFMFPEIR